MAKALKRQAKDAQLVWLQEEPRNMGGWTFMNEHMASTAWGRCTMSDGAPAQALLPDPLRFTNNATMPCLTRWWPWQHFDLNQTTQRHDHADS